MPVAQRLSFIPISTDREEMAPYLGHPFAQEVFQVYGEFYERVPSHAPWTGYFALRQGEVVGVGGFKGSPVDGCVEIAYGTVPEYERQGIASETCRFLTTLAEEQSPDLRITARTLREDNASTRILKRNGYRFAGEVNDPEDGLVWEWEYVRPVNDSEMS